MGRRLASAINPNGDNIAYTYNADGLRTSKTVNNEKYIYYWNGDKLTAQTDNENTWYFRYDGDTLIGFKFNGTEYYYVTNLQGDIIAILDSNGTCVAEYSYDAWGRCSIIKDTNTIAYINPIRYRGYYYDSDTDLYYLQSRYYDANTGRFINADEPKMVEQDVYNLFAYCENNPVMNIDPLGKLNNNSQRKGSRRDAVNYAIKWWNDRKPAFTYDRNANDCASFVYQCLFAGGLSMTNTWAYYRVWFFGWYKVKVTNAWGKANDLYKLLKKSSSSKYSSFSKYKILSTQNDLKKAIKSGNYPQGSSVAFLLNANGDAWHAVFIGYPSKKRDNLFYWAHTSDRNGRNLRSGAGLKEVVNSKTRVAIFSVNYNQIMRF